MTVAELIKELKKYPKDMNVTIPTTTEWECDEYGYVTSVKDVEDMTVQHFADGQGWFDNELDELMIF